MGINTLMKSACFALLAFAAVTFTSLVFAPVTFASETDSGSHHRQQIKTSVVDLVIGANGQAKFLLDGNEVTLSELMEKANPPTALKKKRKSKKPNAEVMMVFGEGQSHTAIVAGIHQSKNNPHAVQQTMNSNG